MDADPMDVVIGWHRGGGYGDEPECDKPNGGECSCGLEAEREAARAALAALRQRLALVEAFLAHSDIWHAPMGDDCEVCREYAAARLALDPARAEGKT